MRPKFSKTASAVFTRWTTIARDALGPDASPSDVILYISGLLDGRRPPSPPK